MVENENKQPLMLYLHFREKEQENQIAQAIVLCWGGSCLSLAESY